MADTSEFLKQVPPLDEIRRRIAENIAQRDLLRTLERIAQKRERLTRTQQGAAAR